MDGKSMTEAERLAERLTEEVFSGHCTVGGASVSSDGKVTSWEAAKIMVLRNPDGPEAAALIRSLAKGDV